MSIGYPEWEINLTKANKILKTENFVSYDPEFSKSTLTIKTPKFVVKINNSGFCMIYSKYDTAEEIKNFLKEIERKLLDARAKK